MVRGCLLLDDGEARHGVGKDTSGRKVSDAFEQDSQVSEARDKGCQRRAEVGEGAQIGGWAGLRSRWKSWEVRVPVWSQGRGLGR